MNILRELGLKPSSLRFSRRIDSLYYDPEKKILLITFHTGNTQIYYQVSDKAYRKLKDSPDPNEYYNEFIYGNYPIDCPDGGTSLNNNKKRALSGST